MTTGFPPTTAASLSTLATGVPPGEHGVTGYTMAVPGFDRAMNALTWSLYGLGPRTKLLSDLPPEQFHRCRRLLNERPRLAWKAITWAAPSTGIPG